MKRELSFYEKFLKLKELIVGLPFEVSMDEKMEAFYSLVDLLLKKGVYKNDGSIQKWRVNSIQYLREVVDLLDEDNLQRAFSVYKRKHALMTAMEIMALRRKYNITSLYNKINK